MMTYVEALHVLKNPDGKIARQAWNGQGFVHQIGGGPSGRYYFGGDSTVGAGRTWKGLFDKQYAEGATDWMDVTATVHWNTALKLLRSGAWKAAMRLSWYQPFFIEPFNHNEASHKSAKDAWKTDDVLESHWPDMAREFVKVGVIKASVAPFDNARWDFVALDWVEATPENMTKLMPKGLDWQSAMNYLKARHFPVRYREWHAILYLRMEGNKFKQYQRTPSGWAFCTITDWEPPLPGGSYDVSGWEVLPPDWFVKQYGKSKEEPDMWDAALKAMQAGAKVRRASWDAHAPESYLYMHGGEVFMCAPGDTDRVYKGGTIAHADWQVMPPGWAPAPYYQKCSAMRAKEYLLEEGRKVRPAYWADAVPNQYLYAVGQAIWIHWNDGKRTYWDGRMEFHHDWQVLPEEFSVFANTNTPIDVADVKAWHDGPRPAMTLPEAYNMAYQCLSDSRKTDVVIYRSSWPKGQQVSFKEWPEVAGEPILVTYLEQPGVLIKTLWGPTLDDRNVNDWTVHYQVIALADGTLHAPTPAPLEDFPFNEALIRLKAGKRVARRSWRAEVVVYTYKPDGDYTPIIRIKYGSGSGEYWGPTQADLLADDWYEVLK